MTETEVERLVVRLTGESSGYVKMINEASSLTKKYGEFTEGAYKETDKLDASLKKTGNTAGHSNNQLRGLLHTVNEYKGALLSIVGISDGMHMLKHSIDLAAEAESSQLSFEVMLKSADKAKKMMTDLREYSSATHISMNTLHSTTKQLLQNNVAGENIMPISRMVGDITGGDAFKFKSLALAFGQTTTTGHLQGDELNQMLSAGFNPLTQMASDRADKSGRKGDADYIKQQTAVLSKEMSQGKISADMVAIAMKNATKEGGMFFGMVEKQAKTFQGAMAQMESEAGNVFRTFGELIVEGLHLPEVVLAISDAVKEVKNFLETLDSGSKKAVVAVMAVIAVFGALTISATILAWAFGMVWASLGPVGLVIIGITALTAGWVVSVGGVESAWKKVRESAVAAWDWLRPVRQSLASLWDFIYESGTDMWVQFKEFTSRTWKSITGDATVDWNKLRDNTIDAILRIEFAMRGMGHTAETIHQRVALGMTRTWEDIQKLFGVQPRGLGDEIEAELKRVRRLSADEFAKFKEDKLKAFAADTKPIEKLGEEGQKAGLKTGKAFQAAAKELQKFDAAAYGSAEALARVMDQQRTFADAQFARDLPNLVGKANKGVIPKTMQEQMAMAFNEAAQGMGLAEGQFGSKVGPPEGVETYIDKNGVRREFDRDASGVKGKGMPTLDEDLMEGRVFPGLEREPGSGEGKNGTGDPVGENKGVASLGRIEGILQRIYDKPLVDLDTADA